MRSDIYIGLLSGTSMDAIDAVAVDFSQRPFRLLAHHSQPFPAELADELQALCFPGSDEINRAGLADRKVAILFAYASLELLRKAGLAPHDIRAIGSHGQTIRHQPHLQNPYTLQIGDPNLIAELTGITTVADFRRRDMACGGQGAPLTPAFHEFAFGGSGRDRIIINIGGIANLTFLPSSKDQRIFGFDSGPGNTLLDSQIMRHLNKSHDQDGAWSASGTVDEKLLGKMLLDPYFSSPAPKSTGKEYFNLAWLDAFMDDPVDPRDVQSTLSELTARSISHAINQHASDSCELLACGGGVHNADLMSRLQRLCEGHDLATSDQYGVDPDWVEGIAFAWLARQTLNNLAGNLPEVTGASHPAVLGGIFVGEN